jgi:hypothetical protein
VIIGWCVAAHAAITAAEPPREGTEVVLLVVDAAGEPRSGETVRAVHRPGLAGEREVAIGITDGRGRVRWAPETSGMTTVRAGEEVQVMRVAPASFDPSVSILLVLLLAAGGGALGLAIREART